MQLMETSHKKITEVMQAEFKRKGSQLKTRIVVYCAYERKRIVEGEITTTYTDISIMMEKYRSYKTFNRWFSG